jgi:hypothetical protein
MRHDDADARATAKDREVALHAPFARQDATHVALA